ncbi:HAD family phosphatase [Corynebacterium sp. CNCTC7651]|uniref:Cof-type HAD-IIB family hydrolase n=1 Tax=Corynebacterium sp. CNCTC7651 TaxID=2815361 RepID=UPI001F1DFE24|nr:HAD family hydrolase [Corynebacterium sp. CNCTC7651]UIZ92038.1 HAD family phosphatase [Corynebacterium sp. CNCTC7651]
MGAPKLIISDIDGTFLNSQGRVSPRLRDVVARAVRRGVHFGLATGRPHRWLMPVLDQLPFAPVCVCANGAVVYDPASDTVLRAFELSTEAMRGVVDAVEEAFAGIPHGYGVERVGSSALDPEEECFLITREYNPDAWDARFGVVSVEELIAVPAAKLLVRCMEMTSAEMFELVAPVINPDDAHVTYSMDEGLLEFSCPGVNKATGVSVLAAQYGVDPSDVVAFGDMPNDLEMLAWSGMGVAMANAAPLVQDAADYVTVTNDEDGVAAVLEHWF